MSKAEMVEPAQSPDESTIPCHEYVARERGKISERRGEFEGQDVGRRACEVLSAESCESNLGN